MQTPHGIDSEKEDGIDFSDFNLISYVHPKDVRIMNELLASRGEAWFRDGVIEHPSKEKPTPNNPKLFYPIVKRILEYATLIPQVLDEDLKGFKERGVDVIKVHPYFKKSELCFKGYDKLLSKILKHGTR